MSEDVTIGPLRCFACGNPVRDPSEWVQAQPAAPVYGLHHGCIGVKFEWSPDNRPIVKPSLEQRVERLEEHLAPTSKWMSAEPTHVPPCDRCRRGDPMPHRPVWSSSSKRA